jgi:GDP-L-fucose synthase
MNELQKRIFVAGHRGMVGSAIVRCLEQQGYTRIIAGSTWLFSGW